MQSIWFGRSESIFGSDEERGILIDYTKQAIDFAAAINCRNLVFGCPKNRNMPADADVKTAQNFFTELADYAASKNCAIALEPNPTLYGTNFINRTSEAIDFAKSINSAGFTVNLDSGTIIENNESDEIFDLITDNVNLISHVHISEPNLVQIAKQKLHQDLAATLRKAGYDKFISIEMKNLGEIELVKETIKYIKEVFS
jgi:sugar phosphate isomerase/epimerase